MIDDHCKRTACEHCGVIPPADPYRDAPRFPMEKVKKNWLIGTPIKSFLSLIPPQIKALGATVLLPSSIISLSYMVGALIPDHSSLYVRIVGGFTVMVFGAIGIGVVCFGLYDLYDIFNDYFSGKEMKRTDRPGPG